MKKQFLFLTAASIMFASCGGGAETPKTETSTPAAAPAQEVAPVAEAASDVPKFSSPEVQALANEYGAFMKESMEAAKSGNAAKMQELQAKATEWATKTQAAAAKMTPEDAKLWGEYATKLATSMAK